MTERLLEPDAPGEPTERSGPDPTPDEGEPTILGFPAEFAADGESEPSGQESDRGPIGTAAALAVLRRPDRFGGVALMLAGVAAGMTLWLPWHGSRGATGFSLVRHGIGAFRAGIGELGRTGLWQPLAVVLGGGLLLVLGCLLLFRARTHRLIGVLALFVAIAVATAVLVPLAAVGWRPAGVGPGMWSGAAVAALGVLGSLKAMLTVPLVGAPPGRPGRTRLGLRMSVLR
jgi:hypothetical protein